MFINTLPVLAAAPGIFGLLQRLAGDVRTTTLVVGGAIVVVVLLITAIKSRLSIVAMLVAGLAGGFVLWLIGNVMNVQSWIGNELSTDAPVVVVSAVDPTPR